MYVIDASVHVADARPAEPHHPEAHALLSRIANAGLVVWMPTIVLAEVAAAISRGTGKPTLARRLVAILRELPYFQFIAIDDALGNLAAELAAAHQIRGCDAVYVALAQQYGARLITLDHEQRERVPSSVLARTPAEELAEIAQRDAVAGENGQETGERREVHPGEDENGA